MTKIALDANYWNNRYLNHETGWDLGEASPPIIEYFKTVENREAAILIPGCGNAYEAEALVELGFTDITLIDISEQLVNSLRKRLSGSGVKIIRADFFEFEGNLDFVIEQTFFCALDPKLRSKYAEKMHALLKDNGKLVGVMFNVNFEGGPPFGGNASEYEQLFSPLFRTNIQPCKTSIAPRLGSELWVEFEKQ